MSTSIIIQKHNLGKRFVLPLIYNSTFYWCTYIYFYVWYTYDDQYKNKKVKQIISKWLNLININIILRWYWHITTDDILFQTKIPFIMITELWDNNWWATLITLCHKRDRNYQGDLIVINNNETQNQHNYAITSVVRILYKRHRLLNIW